VPVSPDNQSSLADAFRMTITSRGETTYGIRDLLFGDPQCGQSRVRTAAVHPCRRECSLRDRRRLRHERNRGSQRSKSIPHATCRPCCYTLLTGIFLNVLVAAKDIHTNFGLDGSFGASFTFGAAARVPSEPITTGCPSELVSILRSFLTLGMGPPFLCGGALSDRLPH